MVVACNAPPKLGRFYQLSPGNGGLKVGELIFYGFRFPCGSPDEQPFFLRPVATPIITMPFTDLHGGKSRGEELVGTLPSKR